MWNDDFDYEFETEEEEEECLDAWVESVMEIFGDHEGDIKMVNPDAVKKVLYTYRMLKYMTKNTKAKVTYELNKPFASMGSVSIVGKKLSFNRPDWFMVAIRLASNFHVYPKINGTVQMDFTFHDLTTTLE